MKGNKARETELFFVSEITYIKSRERTNYLSLVIGLF